jgi:hypothetical protein
LVAVVSPLVCARVMVRTGLRRNAQSMIPKSGSRFSEKIMLKTKSWSSFRFQSEWYSL